MARAVSSALGYVKVYLLGLSERLYEMQSLLSFIARHSESVSATSYVLPDSELIPAA